MIVTRGDKTYQSRVRNNIPCSLRSDIELSKLRVIISRASFDERKDHLLSFQHFMAVSCVYRIYIPLHTMLCTTRIIVRNYTRRVQQRSVASTRE